MEGATVDSLLASLFERCPKCCERLAKQLDINNIRDLCLGANLESKKKVILELVAIFNGNNRVADFSSVGGLSAAGAMRVAASKIIGNPEMGYFVIDQSVTGMFERRTRIGL